MIISVLLTAGIATLFYQLFWFGTVSLENSSDFETITIGEKTYPTIEINSDPTFRLRPGTYSIGASGKRTSPVSETVSLQPFSSKSVVLDSRQLSAIELSSVLINLEDNRFTILDAELLEDDGWLVSYIGSDGTVEGYLTIHEYTISQGWKLRESGTGYDEEYLSELNYPRSVINYITEGSQ